MAMAMHTGNRRISHSTQSMSALPKSPPLTNTPIITKKGTASPIPIPRVSQRNCARAAGSTRVRQLWISEPKMAITVRSR